MECEERVVGERRHTEEENAHQLIVRASKGGRGGREGGDGGDRCLGVTVRVTRVQRGILKEPDHHLKMSTREGKGTRKSHRFDSRDLHNTQQGHSPSSRDDERSEGDKLLPSKWSRYRDSVDSASSSNEEGQGVSTMKTEERADVFGIDKLLP